MGGRAGNDLKRPLPYLLCILAVSGCMGGPNESRLESGEQIPRFEDARGDAPGFLDFLNGGLVEESDFLVAEFEIAALDPSTLLGQLRAHDAQKTNVALCWRFEPSTDDSKPKPTDCALLELGDFSPNTPHQAQYWSIREPDCPGLRNKGPNHDGLPGADWGCGWIVPHAVQGTDPARFRISIPRPLLPDPAIASTIHDIRGLAWVHRYADRSPPGTLPGYAWAGACTTGQPCVYRGVDGVGGGPNPPDDLRDDAGPAPGALALRLRSTAPLPLSNGRPLLIAARELATANPYPMVWPRAELDLLRVDLEETPTELALVMHLADVPSRPYHRFKVDLTFGDHRYLGEYTVRAGQVSQIGMQTDASGDSREFPATVDFRPGTPGTVRFATKWADFGALENGKLLTFSEVYFQDPGVYAEHRQWLDPPGRQVYVYGGVSFPCCDWTAGHFPYVLTGRAL